MIGQERRRSLTSVLSKQLICFFVFMEEENMVRTILSFLEPLFLFHYCRCSHFLFSIGSDFVRSVYDDYKKKKILPYDYRHHPSWFYMWFVHHELLEASLSPSSPVPSSPLSLYLYSLYLRSDTPLPYLNLYNAGISDRHLVQIMRALRIRQVMFPQVCTLDPPSICINLGSNRLSLLYLHRDIIALSPSSSFSSPRHPFPLLLSKIVSISLNQNCIGNEGLGILIRWISLFFPSLISLSLSENPIDDDGAQTHLCPFLSVSSTLSFLCLCRTLLSSLGKHRIQEAWRTSNRTALGLFF